MVCKFRGAVVAVQAENSGVAEGASGLRSRKKAKRREEILAQARTLFEQKGIQATTMAEIADAADISPPTVFNYFGNKDGILIALITEGSNRSRASRLAAMARDDKNFAAIVCDTLAEISRVTLAIADKRVWRYAEAAAIRHPTTDLAQRYLANDDALRASMATFFDRYDLNMRAPVQADTALLGGLFFDIWNASFFDLIRDEDMTLDAHCAKLPEKITPLCNLLFSDDFLHEPKLKP